MWRPRERKPKVKTNPEGRLTMDNHIKIMLSALRQAVNEAILGSHDVNAAMAALGRTGRCPSLSVDVTLENESGEVEVNEPVAGALISAAQNTAVQSLHSGELILSSDDEEFLLSLGITPETGATVTAKLH
jgi:hypothetical protein